MARSIPFAVLFLLFESSCPLSEIELNQNKIEFHLVEFDFSTSEFEYPLSEIKFPLIEIENTVKHHITRFSERDNRLTREKFGLTIDFQITESDFSLKTINKRRHFYVIQKILFRSKANLCYIFELVLFGFLKENGNINI